MEIGSRVAFVTGGATGVGRAVCNALAARGARGIGVGFFSGDEDLASETCAALADKGASAMPIPIDVRDEGQVRAGVAKIVDAWGTIDILVNSAGRTTPVAVKDLEAITDELWNDIMDTNLRGTFYTCRASAPYLKRQGGAIVNIGSISGMRGPGSSIPYSLSKAGVHRLTALLALALAPEVRVNAVAPGLVPTRLFAEVMGEQAQAVIQERAATVPLARVASPEDIAAACIGLLESDYVTGHVVPADGGELL
jgi:NAD(P)-dependent dehydrogenase (short-subunit alcohol dehydrogenase family)